MEPWLKFTYGFDLRSSWNINIIIVKEIRSQNKASVA